MSKINRREFLRRYACTALAGAGAYSTLSGLNLMNAMADDGGDYRALVCVFLFGGNDSFNMFVPRDEAPYNAYREARRNLAVSRDSLLPVNPVDSDGVHYGFHSSLPEVRDLFNQGKVSVIGNVGPLMVPTTRDDFINARVPLPPRLFSHNDQQDFWQSLDTDVSQPTGWAGRMADALASMNSNRKLSMNVSMAGSNLMQTGHASIPYILSPSGVVTPKSRTLLSDFGRRERRETAINSLLQQDAGHLLGGQYRSTMKRAMELSSEIGSTLNGTASINAGFSNSPLSESLQMVARMISVQRELGLRRQVFFVGYGGWDTHGNQNARHPGLLRNLSQSLGAFYRSTDLLGLSQNVTTFTAADFGRTLTSNGDGSDHGWGGHQLVMGGAVRGNRIFGQMPEIRIDGSSDSGRGRIIPTASVDQYCATLARWFGLSQGSVDEVFPNLRYFDQKDLGFMS